MVVNWTVVQSLLAKHVQNLSRFSTWFYKKNHPASKRRVIFWFVAKRYTGCMKSSYGKAARAVAAVLIGRSVFPLTIAIAVFGSVLTLVATILVVVHSGWWLIALPFTLVIAIGGVVSYLIARYIVAKLAPRPLARDERKVIQDFVDHFSEGVVAGQIVKRNPVIFGIHLAFRYLTGGSKGAADAVLQPIDDIKQLRQRFATIVALFDSSTLT